MKTKLEKLIPEYAKNKAFLDDYTNICKKQNAEIKKIMSKSKLDKYEADGYKVTYSETEREKFNEEKLLELAHAKNIKIIKKKEYIDFDLLENLIYNNKISKEVLMEIDKYRETSVTVTLRISKTKNKEK